MIPEPILFDPKWVSHKFKGAGVRYEIGIAIGTGIICWVHGPFPCGEWPDIRIARDALIYMVDDNERMLADGGYSDAQQYFITPTGRHDFSDRQATVARAQHETVNTRFKNFGCLRQFYRHQRKDHCHFFRACALIVNLELVADKGSFQVEFNQIEFS